MHELKRRCRSFLRSSLVDVDLVEHSGTLQESIYIDRDCPGWLTTGVSNSYKPFHLSWPCSMTLISWYSSGRFAFTLWTTAFASSQRLHGVRVKKVMRQASKREVARNMAGGCGAKQSSREASSNSRQAPDRRDAKFGCALAEHQTGTPRVPYQKQGPRLDPSL